MRHACAWRGGESNAGAMFGQQAEPRGGAATEPSDDEARVVADSCDFYCVNALY